MITLTVHAILLHTPSPFNVGDTTSSCLSSEPSRLLHNQFCPFSFSSVAPQKFRYSRVPVWAIFFFYSHILIIIYPWYLTTRAPKPSSANPTSLLRPQSLFWNGGIPQYLPLSEPQVPQIQHIQTNLLSLPLNFSSSHIAPWVTSPSAQIPKQENSVSLDSCAFSLSSVQVLFQFYWLPLKTISGTLSSSYPCSYEV